jgi:hypothetical protein
MWRIMIQQFVTVSVHGNIVRPTASSERQLSLICNLFSDFHGVCPLRPGRNVADVAGGEKFGHTGHLDVLVR